MQTITIKTTVNAPLANVWNSWTQPEHIIHWNFANDAWYCPSAKNDVRPGGEFSWRMEAKDGSMGFDINGVYDEVIEQELITYHLSDERAVRIEFEQIGDAVQIRESFHAEDQHTDEQQRAGWKAVLENFKMYTEEY